MNKIQEFFKKWTNMKKFMIKGTLKEIRKESLLIVFLKENYEI